MYEQFLNYEQLLQCHGKRFNGFHGSQEIEGVVFIEENQVFLLQDNVNGRKPKDESFLSYGYSGSFLHYDSNGVPNVYSTFSNITLPDYVETVIETSSIEDTSVKSKDVLSNITTSELQTLLLAVEIQLPVQTTDRIIDCIELLQEKGDSITISDINKLKSEWNNNQN